MIHITDYAWFHEQGYYTPGDTGAPVYDTAAGRLGVAICYDRHYPEYMRALGGAGRRDWWSCRRPARSASGRRGSTRPRCGWRPSRTATSPRSATASARRKHVTFAGESFVCGPDGSVIARAGAARGDDPLRRRRPDRGAAVARPQAVPAGPPAGSLRRLAQPLTNGVGTVSDIAPLRSPQSNGSGRFLTLRPIRSPQCQKPSRLPIRPSTSRGKLRG